MKQHFEKTSWNTLNKLYIYYSHMTGILCFTNEEPYISPSYCSGNLGGKILLYDLTFGFACLLLGNSCSGERSERPVVWNINLTVFLNLSHVKIIPGYVNVNGANWSDAIHLGYSVHGIYIWNFAKC